MERQLQIKLLDVNKEIEELKIAQHLKSLLYRIEKCIIASPNGRVYSINKKDYQEYICFKIPASKQDEKMKFCISKRMIEHSGATAGRENQFPSYDELVEYIKKHQQSLESELTALEYQIAEQNATTKKSTSQSLLEVIKEKVSKLPGSNAQKARVYKVLDTLELDDNKKIYTAREDSYDEFISVINGYLTVTQKIYNYAGSPESKNVYILKSNKLIEYVEGHKEIIDKELTSPKRCK